MRMTTLSTYLSSDGLWNVIDVLRLQRRLQPTINDHTNQMLTNLQILFENAREIILQL
jgi:hypothetical protein